MQEEGAEGWPQTLGGLQGKISAPWVSPAGWPFWSRGWGQFSAKGHVINKQALGAIQFLLRVLLRKRGKKSSLPRRPYENRQLLDLVPGVIQPLG